ncbi:MAG: PAS domain-containing protein [Rhodobiaceae bacterium]|nr:PAS domain-containing protein [Rhodobiaceae bacterium]
MAAAEQEKRADKGVTSRNAPDIVAVAIVQARVLIIVAAAVFGFLYLSGVTSIDMSIIGFFALAFGAVGQTYFAEDRRRRDVARAVADSQTAKSREGIGSVVLEQMLDAVVLLDGDGRIIYHNRSAERFVGLTATGKLVPSVLREPILLDAIERVRTGGAAEEIEYVSPVPVEHHYQVVITPAETAEYDGTGTPTLLALHDVTDMKRVEQMRVDFVANASHELKTPLASLSGFIETLQGPAKEDADAQEKFLGIMGEQATRMQRLIEDLLSLSRIELREHMPPRGTVSVSGLVKDVVDAIGPIAERDQVTIDVDLQDDLPMIRGDWDELLQVAQNLVDNAVKYGQSGGRVEISADRIDGLSDSSDGSCVELKVRDFGPGIPREQIPRLTERFYRIDVATSRERGGTGLGLAIVKHILNRHKTELRCDSIVGEGSVFSIRFPVA